jgi:hypothetical protein
LRHGDYPAIDVVASLAAVGDYRTGRRIALGNMAMLALGWVIFVFLPPRISAADLIATVVFAAASAYTLVAVPAAARRRVRPLPVGLSEEDARKRSFDGLTAATGLAGAFGLVVPYGALCVAMLTKNPWTYAVPFVVAEVILYLYALPAPRTLAAIKQRLEADGATAYLDLHA